MVQWWVGDYGVLGEWFTEGDRARDHGMVFDSEMYGDFVFNVFLVWLYLFSFFNDCYDVSVRLGR